jgi:CheY-like chemotaxis protein
MNPQKSKSGAGQPASILVVDDAPANLQVLAGMLKDRGYKARPVPSGKLALLAASSRISASAGRRAARGRKQSAIPPVLAESEVALVELA